MEVDNPRSYLETLTPDEFDRVDLSLARTQRGVSIDLVSPLVPNRRKQDYGRRLRIAETSQRILSTGYEWLDQIENAQREKIGPYSIMLPYDSRREQVYSYFQKRKLNVHVQAWNHATFELQKEVLLALHSVSEEIAFDQMPKGTNLGLPWLSRDKEYRPAVLAKVRDLVNDQFVRPQIDDPAILYWRGQPRGLTEVPKQRTIWGMPHYITVCELMIQIPLLNYLRTRRGYSAWVGTDAVNEEMTYILDHSIQPILSVDFSGFDASIPGVLIHQVFEVIKTWFIPDDWPLIDYVELCFQHIGLLTPEGILVGKDGGVPSGSGLTNMIDTLVQKFAFHYVAYRLQNKILHHAAQGDDGVVVWRDHWELDYVTEAMSELGLVVSSDKGGVSNERVYFLQNVHSTDYRQNGLCVGVRPVFKVLNGALSYERFRKKGEWNSYDDTLRWYQQWESARFHPRFSEFVALLLEWDTYTQKYTVEEIVDGAGGIEKAQSVLNEKAFPYGKESLSGLRDYRTVRILNKLKGHQNPE